MDTFLGFLLTPVDPLVELARTVGDVAPPVVTAVLLLLIGSWACLLLSRLLDHVFKLITIDDFSRKIGLSTILYRLGLGASVGHLMRVLVTAVVFLGFLVGSFTALNLPIIPEYLRYIGGIMPRLIGAVLILGGGLFLGDLIGHIISRAADANGLRGSEILMRVTHGIIVFFSTVFALGHLGLDVMALITGNMQMIVTSICLALAIAFGVAFGMAGKEMAGRLIRDLTPGTKPRSGVEPKMKVVR
jgi:hypothetical protein